MMDNPGGHLWKDEYKIGNKTVDSQHYQLFYNIERLIYVSKKSDFEAQKKECNQIIAFLMDYTVKHFSEEEAYQRETGYVSYKLHKKIHDNFKNTIVMYKEKLDKEYSVESVQHLTGTLLTWLVVHVLGCDMKIPANVPIGSSLVFDSAENCIRSVVNSILGNMYGLKIHNIETCMYKGFIDGDIFIETVTGGNKNYKIVYGISKSLAVSIFKKMSGMDLSSLDAPDELSKSAFLELGSIFSTYIFSGLSGENDISFSMEHNLYIGNYPATDKTANNLLLEISTDAGKAEIMITYQNKNAV